MADLQSRRLIVFKGGLFLAISLTSAVLIILAARSWKIAALLALLVWSSCRFYYFLFYVLEHYVDPTMRYAGILDLLQGMKKRRQRPRD